MLDSIATELLDDSTAKHLIVSKTHIQMSSHVGKRLLMSEKLESVRKHLFLPKKILECLRMSQMSENSVVAVPRITKSEFIGNDPAGQQLSTAGV